MTAVDLLLGPRRVAPPSEWSPLSAMLAFMAVAALAIALALGLVMTTHGLAPGELVALRRSCTSFSGVSETCEQVEFWFADFFYLLLPAGLLLLGRIKSARGLLLASPGWRPWQYVGFALVCVLVSGLAHQALWLASEAFGGSTANLLQDFEMFRQHLDSGYLLNFALFVGFLVILAPLAEEFVFRGFLFTALLRTPLGFLGSAVLLSGVWALLHWGYSWQSVSLLFGLGILYAYAAWRTGSVWPAVVGHATNNLVAVITVLVYLPQA
jgi:membrane protease YdiL (CAAX protease family)